MGALPWGDISAREAEVLAAVGEHLTNAQIAGRLHISARTVESHVSALLRKCGASDRRRLAVLAAESAELGARSDDAVLPAARTSFVGRAEELEAVRTALDDSRLVTLTGPGGVGKTRLAVTAAGAVAARFPAGLVYLDLVPVPPGQVVATAATALGVTERPPRPLLDSVADRVRGRVMLLVLDNCEHVLDDVGGLVEALLRVGGGLRILTTSRERLGVMGEEAHAVPPLPLGSAAETLFLDRARGLDRTFAAAPALITEACARLDGLPLAIELAAARAAAIGVDGLLTALDDRLRAVVGARGGEARHHSLTDVLGWSYDLLDPAERALFRRLAVFAAGFDLDAAAAVSPGERPSTIAHLLGRLVEKSLVVRRGTERTRYRLLETVRAFALEHFTADDDRDEVLRAHLEWASRVAVELETKLDRDDADDRRAVVAGAGAQPDSVALETSRAERGGGHRDDRGDGAGPGGRDGRADPAGGVDRGGHEDRSRPAAAYDKAVGGLRAGLARAGEHRGPVARGTSDPAAAYDEVVDDLRAAFARTAGEPDPVAHQLGRALAHLTFARGSFVESRAHYRAAADRATAPADAVRDLRSASEAAQSLADGDDAFDLLLTGADRAGDERDRAVMLALAVTLATRFVGDFRHAVPTARRAELLARAERTPVEDQEHAAVLATARAWHAGASPAAAIEAAQEAGDPTLLQGALDSANSAAARQGRLREAYRIARERLDLVPMLTRHQPADGIEMFDLFHSVSVCALAVGDLPGALAIAARATEQDPVNGDYPFVSRLKYLAPLTLSGHFDEAIELGERAFAEWRAAGAPLLAWLTPSVQMLELAAGLRGDHGLWRARTLEFAGKADPRPPRLAAPTAFVEARLAVHNGHLTDADRLVRNAFQEFAQPWYRAYANAAGAEVAVLAQLPDAEKRLEQAERTAEENDWAAACVARARGRFTGDATAFQRSLEIWERIGARFELERTEEASSRR